MKEVNSMTMDYYPEFAAGLASRRIPKRAVAKCIGVCEKAFNNKLRGRTPFTWPEVKQIRDEFFPDMLVEDLFANAQEWSGVKKNAAPTRAAGVWSKAFFEQIALPGCRVKNVRSASGHVWVELELADGFDGNAENLRKQYCEICMRQAPVGHEHTLTVSVVPSSV